MTADVFITPQGAHWRRPCGAEKRHPRSETKPIATLVSLLERTCPFCGRQFKPEYVQHSGGEG
jgi:hypothetical protein